MMNPTQWCENVMLIDADYLDRTAFDLIVNFERMIGRPLPAADLCRWIDCVALDGGLTPEGGVDRETQVVFLHAKERTGLEYFRPSAYATELDGVAFRDNLGEFSLHSYAVEDIVDADTFYRQCFDTLLEQSAVKRIMAVADMERLGADLRSAARRATDKEVTLFTMQPQPGPSVCRQEILGYSLMSALGIRSEELR